MINDEMARVIELHIIQARELALRLMSFSSAILPKEFNPIVGELVTKDLSAFAYQARRISDLCGLKDLVLDCDIDRFPINKAHISYPIEKNYHYALNRLIHAEGYQINYSAWLGDKIFLDSTDTIIMHAIVKTDKHNYAAINIFGLSHCFLNSIFNHIHCITPKLNF